MTEQLDLQEKAMKQQEAFLDSAAYWYSIPSFITNIIFIIGLENPADYNWSNKIAENILPLTFNLKTITIIGLTFFYGFTVWINKRAANKGIKPLFGKLKSNAETIKKRIKLLGIFCMINVLNSKDVAREIVYLVNS